MPIVTLTNADKGLPVELSKGLSWTVNGTDAEDKIVIAAGATVEKLNLGGGTDTVSLSGKAGDYKISASGTNLVLTAADGKTVTLPLSTGGDNLTFADGTIAVKIETVGGKPSLNIGGQAIDPTSTDAKTPVALAPTTIDATKTSAADFIGTVNPAVKPTLTLSTANATVAENAGTVKVTANLSAAKATDTVVTLGATGTATAGEGKDYTIGTAEVTIKAGQVSADVDIKINDDVELEGTETITLTATTADTNVQLDTAKNAVTLSITDNDANNPNVTNSSTDGALPGRLSTTTSANFTQFKTLSISDANDSTTTATFKVGNGFLKVDTSIAITSDGVTANNSFASVYSTLSISAKDTTAGTITITGLVAQINNLIANGRLSYLTNATTATTDKLTVALTDFTTPATVVNKEFTINIGKTLALTASTVDTVTGTTGDDDFTAAAGVVVEANDTVNGDTGNDTLTFAGATGQVFYNTAATQFTNVEKIKITPTGDVSVDLTKVTASASGTTVEFVPAAADGHDLTVTGLKAGFTVLANTNGIVTTNGVTTPKTTNDLNLTATASTDTVAVALDGSDSLGSVTVGTATTLSIASTGTAANSISTIATTASALTKVIITGNAGLTITNLPNGVSNVDASAATGNLKLTATAQQLTFNGGAGADTLIGHTGNDTINGNAGNDSIDGTAGNDVLSGGDGNDTITGKLVGTSNADIATTTVSGGNGDDTLTVAIDDSTTDTGSPLNADSYTAILNGDAGNDNITVTTTVGATTGTNTFAITVNAGDGNDTVTGSSVADVIVGGTGADVLAGGTGNDTFKFVTGDSLSTARDTISDLTNGDIVDLTGYAFTALTSGGALSKLAVAKAADNVLDVYVDSTNNRLVIETSDNGTAVTTEEINIGNASKAAWTVGSTGKTFTVGNQPLVADNNNAGLLTLTGAAIGGAAAVVLKGVEAPTVNSVASGTTAVSTVDATKVVIDGTTNTTSGIALTSQATYSVKVTGSSYNDSINLGTTHTSAVTVDGGAGNDTITGGTGADSLTGSAGDDGITGNTGNDTIDGGTGNDSITGDAGDDSITAGAGTDTIDGGAGKDTIILTETTAAIDGVLLDTTNASSEDSITGFTVGATSGDVLVLSTALKSGDGTGTTTVDNTDDIAVGTKLYAPSVADATMNFATTAAAKVAVVLDLTALTNATNFGTISASALETLLNASTSNVFTGANTAVVNGGNSTKAVLLADNGTNTGVFLYSEKATADLSFAGELTLLATLNGVTSGLTHDNFYA